MTAPFQNTRTKLQVSSVPGLALWVRHALCDETVVEEVIERDCYRLREMDLRGKTVLDCGAHIGVFSTFAAHLGARVVIAVEPQPENLELLRLNVEPYPQVAIFAEAVGAAAGTMHMRGESGGAHIVYPSGEHEPDCVEVKMTTLTTLIKELGAVDVLKMDMEGGEVPALLACDHEWLAKVGRIVMETHGPSICPWVERPHVGEIVEHLLPTHNVEVQGAPAGLGYLFATRNGARV